MTTEQHIAFIQQHGGTFPVPDIAAHLGFLRSNGSADSSQLYKRARGMNGQVNFDETAKTLNVQQLHLITQAMREGKKPLTDPLKIERMDGFFAAAKELGLLEGNGAALAPMPVTKKTNRRRNTRKKAVETEPTAENQLKESFLTNEGFLLSVVAGLVLVQSSHFALYYIGRIGDGGLWMPLTVAYGILIGLLVEAMGLILVSNGRGKHWLAVIAVVSLCVNFLFYETYMETGWDFLGELVLSAIIPGCIYLISELYVEKGKK